MGADPDRITFATPLVAGVLVVADQLLLLGVDADHRVSGGLEVLGLVVATAELCIPVRLVGTFDGLGVALETEALLARHGSHGVRREPVPPPGQLGSQVPRRLRRPAQRRHRIPAYTRFHQGRQRGPTARIQVHRTLAAPTGPTHPPQRHLPGLQSCHPTRHGALPDSSRTSDEPDASMAQRPCFCSYGQPPLPLVEMRGQRRELRGQRCLDPLRSPRTTTTIHRAGSDGLFPGKP